MLRYGVQIAAFAFAAGAAAMSLMGATPTMVGEVVAVRSKDGLATDGDAARIVRLGSRPDVLLVPHATPSRHGPDAGAILCYAVAGSSEPDRPAAGAHGGLVLFTSVDQGRSWSDAEPVVINGWPKELDGRRPDAPSAVQLPDDRIRLYFTIAAPESRRPARVPPMRTPSRDGGATDDGPQDVGARTDRVYSAISNDGRTFAFEDGVRYELAGLSSPEVVRLPDPPSDDTRKLGPWLMFVTRDGSTLLATSRDGLSWIRDETFVWTSAHEASAVLTAEAGREVRLYGCDRSGIVSVRFDPSTGDLHPDPGVRWGPKHADPSAARCGDGAMLLVCVQESTDKPSGPRREPPPLPMPDRPTSPPDWRGVPK